MPGVPLGTDVGGALGLTPVAWTLAEGTIYRVGYPDGSTYWGWVPPAGTTGVWDTMGCNGLELPGIPP